ncbi:hypothetical protein C8Q76DRAFT_726190 [Earliella scabrosa]|nr:hypothetical protein C8Q76DRAFT_726190 [Earliella scabrosa]
MARLRMITLFNCLPKLTQLQTLELDRVHIIHLPDCALPHTSFTIQTLVMTAVRVDQLDAAAGSLMPSPELNLLEALRVFSFGFSRGGWGPILGGMYSFLRTTGAHARLSEFNIECLDDARLLFGDTIPWDTIGSAVASCHLLQTVELRLHIDTILLCPTRDPPATFRVLPELSIFLARFTTLSTLRRLTFTLRLSEAAYDDPYPDDGAYPDYETESRNAFTTDLGVLDELCARLCERLEALKTITVFVDADLLSQSNEKSPNAVMQDAMPRLHAMGVLEAVATHRGAPITDDERNGSRI